MAHLPKQLNGDCYWKEKEAFAQWKDDEVEVSKCVNGTKEKLISAMSEAENVEGFFVFETTRSVSSSLIFHQQQPLKLNGDSINFD
jgi:hypothetical protein